MACLKLTIYHRGLSLIEVLLVAAIMSTFFVGLFGSLSYTLALINDSRSRLTALSVANDEMEYIRSLSYDSVGTVSGIPSGLIPQTSTTTLNGIEFTKRVLVEYVDDDADGVGAADSNGITTDYKQAKITVSWSYKGEDKELFLVSNIIPRSIETNVGGGKLRVHVFDAGVMPLPGVSVRVVNDDQSPSIDVTRTTDASGTAIFGGAPAGSGYQISAFASGYSTDQTYEASTELPNPTTLPVSVVEADISTVNFFIDELGQLKIRTLGEQTVNTSSEDFADSSGVATSSQVAVASSSLTLSQAGGVYASAGTAILKATSPTPLKGWEALAFEADTPGSTTARLQLYTGTSTLTLIPESDLPGNNAGFGAGVVDLTALSAAAYPELAVGLVLETVDGSETPAVSRVAISYIESETALSGVDLEVTGAKTIGTEASSTPIYKTEASVTTDASGEYTFSGIEWDAYTVTAPGYDIAEACPADPAVVLPGEATELELLLVADSSHTLRVQAQTPSGVPLSGAVVTLSRTGFSETINTSGCGQAFFSGLTSAADYRLEISPAGHDPWIQTELEVTGDIVSVVQF